MTTNTNVPEESYNRCNSGENEIFYPIRVYEVGARYVFDCLQILKFELGCFFFFFFCYTFLSEVRIVLNNKII